MPIVACVVALLIAIAASVRLAVAEPAGYAVRHFTFTVNRDAAGDRPWRVYATSTPRGVDVTAVVGYGGIAVTPCPVALDGIRAQASQIARRR